MKMNWFMKVLSKPLARAGVGFLAVFVTALLAAVFPPLAVLTAPLIFLILFVGESSKVLWFESDAAICCAHCGEETKVRLVRVRHCMFPFIPLPLIGALCRMLAIPYRSSYYRICDGCLNSHVGEQDFQKIKLIAEGGLATVQEITAQEFRTLVRK